MTIKTLTLFTALLCATGSSAQNEYAEIARLRGMNETVRGIRPMADGEHYTTIRDPRAGSLRKGEALCRLCRP